MTGKHRFTGLSNNDGEEGCSFTAA